MEKSRAFSYDKIEVCRNCNSEGHVLEAGKSIWKTCPVCCGSGLVKKHYEGTVTMEPYERDE